MQRIFEQSHLILERLVAEGRADPDEIAAFDIGADPDVLRIEKVQRIREGQYWRRVRRRAFTSGPGHIGGT
jgi:hypothetical protein